MTRTEDVYRTLAERYSWANALKVDIFVSIHHNSSNPAKKGYRVLYTGKHDQTNSSRLANAIDTGFVCYTNLERYAYPTSNTGLAVLNGTKMPAVLVECGYMGGDLVYCRDNPGKIALAIYYGIISYFYRYG